MAGTPGLPVCGPCCLPGQPTTGVRMLYGVFCRLARPAGEYPTLYGAIQSIAIASWAFPESCWLIESEHRPEVIRDAIRAALEEGDVALVFPMEVGPARWTSLREHRFGRQFLQAALEREQATRAVDPLKM